MPEHATIPIANSLSEIYASESIPSEVKRWNSLLQAFKAIYLCPPTFIARAPGRVNLIGEHIDYSLYDVLPMAITADILVAVSVVPAASPSVNLSNKSPGKFSAQIIHFSHDGHVEIDDAVHHWSNYFKAGLHGAIEMLKSRAQQEGRTFRVSSKMNVLVDGKIPSGSGLSSSAALVCASMLASLAALAENFMSETALGRQRTHIDQLDFAEKAIVAERRVGMAGGGMDQAASLCSKRNCLSYVRFVPKLSVEPLTLPLEVMNPQPIFMIADTLVVSNKRATAPTCYNLRMVECTLAALMLRKMVGLTSQLPYDSSPLGHSLRGFQTLYFLEMEGFQDSRGISINTHLSQLRQLHALVEEQLDQAHGYTQEEICATLQMSLQELHSTYLSKFPLKATRFLLRQRALHVFSEAARVIEFRKTITTAAETTPTNTDSIHKELGSIMENSQISCRDVFECTCPEIDQLCNLAVRVGSYGSRLTGAGWGGATVHLAAKNDVEKIKKAWIDGYYRKHWPDITEEELSRAITASEPSSGAYLYQVTSEDDVVS